ncbi:hypothetical protein [Bradyrhizobium sp. CB2312]|uniref:hypothetical protein n=1 Tax=Bradyrhizobium sp. CB2312 TaxID=3039155 RepID=UPI0024B1B94B|nr:hypothetical protein [Bradyrhizobium sp. CB2312]WFU75226.1 hypothetical protein QA642_14975 [Bradyrhizobium sp. CB2312]
MVKLSKTRLVLAAAFLAITTHAHAGALIANCKLKPNATVKTMPSRGTKHLSFAPTAAGMDVEVYDQHGGQWAYIEGEHAASKMRIKGWMLRSSLDTCQNIKPWE